MIRKYSEYRLLKFLAVYVIIISSLSLISHYTLNVENLSFISVQGVLDSDGRFLDPSVSKQYMDMGTYTLSTSYFLSSMLILIALYLQWGIEETYSIKIELILILIVYSICSETLTGVQAV